MEPWGAWSVCFFGQKIRKLPSTSKPYASRDKNRNSKVALLFGEAYLLASHIASPGLNWLHFVGGTLFGICWKFDVNAPALSEHLSSHVWRQQQIGRSLAHWDFQGMGECCLEDYYFSFGGIFYQWNARRRVIIRLYRVGRERLEWQRKRRRIEASAKNYQIMVNFVGF